VHSYVLFAFSHGFLSHGVQNKGLMQREVGMIERWLYPEKIFFCFCWLVHVGM